MTVINMQELNEKEAFSQRLKQQLATKEWGTNSPTWLAREFNIRYSGNSISVQTASNWLSGTAIPSQDKLQVLAAWLDISSQWLRFGENDVALTQSQPEPNIPLLSLNDLPDKIAKLNPKQKYMIYQIVEEFLSCSEKS